MNAPAAEPLGRRILRETARFAALQSVAAALAWLVNLLLARRLDARDFGVYSICTFWIGVGTTLGDGGLGATLLRRKGEVSRDEYRVTLTALVVVASVLAAALVAAAGWIGARNHFTAAETQVLRAMAPLYVVSALRVVPYIRLERELAFARIGRIELTASLARHAVALTVAFAKGGVWALAGANLVGAALQLALAYRAAPGWVGFGWSWRTFRPLIAYGGTVQLLAICAFIKDNISAALLGTRLGPSAVGMFDFGMKYIQVPVVAVNSLARVQLPVYARLRADDPTLHGALRGAVRFALLVGVPGLCALALAAPWVVPVLYAPKWAPSYPVIWSLLANMIGGLMLSPLFTLLQGQGRARLAVVVFGLWTTATWGLTLAGLALAPGALYPAAVAYSVATVSVTAWLLAWAARHLGRPVGSSVAAPLVAGMGALGVGLVMAAKGPAVLHHPLATVGGALVAYLVVLVAIEGRLVVDELRSIVAAASGRSRTVATPARADADLDRAA